MGDKLSEKVIVITGGTKGIGRGVAVSAAQEGAKVVIGGRSIEDGEEVVNKITNEYNGKAMFVKGDLTNIKACQELIDNAVEEFDKIDGLFNYAGTTACGKLIETDEDLFDKVFNLNIKAAFFCTKYATQIMKENEGGSIVNAGSTHVHGGNIDHAAYASSKGALLSLTKHVAKNYAKDKIRCNFLTIGWVPTPTEKVKQKKEMGLESGWEEKMGKKMMPMGRLQKINDFVPGVIYLLSDIASQVTGTELKITGGFTP